MYFIICTGEYFIVLYCEFKKNSLIHCYLYYLVIYLAVEMFTSDFGLRKKYYFMINA